MPRCCYNLLMYNDQKLCTLSSSTSQLSMTKPASIYVRTTQGRVTAFNPSAKLSPALKAVLKGVDGRTASELLITKFADVGEVPKLLAALETAGLIAEKNTTSGGIDLQTPLGRSARVPAAQSAQNSGHSLLTPSDSAQSLLDPGNTIASAEDWMHTAASSLDDSVPSKPASLMDRMAQQVADQMATFVLTHLPQKAFAELFEIEKILSVDQLKRSFPNYELLAKSVGPAGEEHIEELHSVIDKLFAQ
jgi:hypothetical protein